MSRQQLIDLDANLRLGRPDFTADVVTLRAGFDELMAQIPVPGDVAQRSATIGGVNAVEVTIDGIDATSVILYLHGGVYVIGSAVATVPLVSDLARRAHARAITVDYRLAPEHPFPAAVDDARAAYEGLLDDGIGPEQIALAGESAGGGLTIALMLELRKRGTPLPSCAFVMSPYTDLTLSGDTLVEKESADAILTPDGLRLRVSDYVASNDAADPRISPIFGDLTGLPPLLIQVGSHEILLSDALRLAARAAMNDVEVTLEVVPGAPHVFQGFAALVEEANAALDRAATFVAAHSGAG
jgi:monoterpene epsilon-lactone hydrolase